MAHESENLIKSPENLGLNFFENITDLSYGPRKASFKNERDSQCSFSNTGTLEKTGVDSVDKYLEIGTKHENKT